MGTGAWLTGPLIEARMTSSAPVLHLDLPPDFLHLPELQQKTLLAPFLEELKEALDALDPKRMHAFGFDFARIADLSVAKLLSIASDLKRESALTVEMRGVPGDEQKMIVAMILRAAPRLVGAAFDATGMGWIVAEDMGRLFGLRDKDHPAGLVHAIKFSQEWYRVNMPPLKVAFEDNAIAISKNDEHLSDLRLVKVIRGIPMIPDARTGEGSKKRHGDYAIALALAHFASRMEWHEYSYAAAVPRESRFSESSRSNEERPFRMASTRGKRGTY
jgi:phage FluMu gp28-like protein